MTENQIEINRLERAIRDNPDSIAPRLQLSRVMIRMGRREEARQILLEAQSLEPDNKYLAMQLDLLNRGGKALGKTDYAFSSATDLRNMNRWIRVGFMLIILVVGLVVLRLIVFPGTRKMVVSEQNNTWPIWSPDGKHFGFYRIGGRPTLFRVYSGGEFWIADAQGDNPSQFQLQVLDASPNDSYGFSWSHDGKWLAFVRELGYELHVCICRPDGTDYFNAGIGSSPEWSPMENKLAFIREDHASRYWHPGGALMTLDQSQKLISAIVKEGVTAFSWSPDGNWIAFQKDEKQQNRFDEFSFDQRDPSNIWKIRVTGENPIQLTHENKSIQPKWLPNDSGILYLKGSGDLGFELWRMNRSGEDQKMLYDKTCRFNEYTPYAISPNSKWIAFERYSGVLMDADFSGDFEIDSDRDAFSGAFDVYLARTDGSQIFRLKNIHENKSSPVFSKDSRWLAYQVRPLGSPVEIWRTRVP